MKKNFIIALILVVIAFAGCEDQQNITDQNPVVDVNINETIVNQNSNDDDLLENNQKDTEKVFIDNSDVSLVPVVNEDRKWGYVDKTRTLIPVIPFQYDQAYPFNEVEDVAIVVQDDEYFLIDKQGQEVKDSKGYNRIEYLDVDLLIAEKDGNFYIISTSGERLETSEDRLSSHVGVAYKKTDGIYFYFDTTTLQWEPLKYSSDGQVLPFIEGYKYGIDVVYDETIKKYYAFNEEKNMIPSGTDYLEILENTIIYGEVYQKDEFTSYYRVGLLDHEGNILIDPKYMLVDPIVDDYFSVANEQEFWFFQLYLHTEAFPKAIFRRAEILTGFDYYYITHVKDDWFYVYDGISYYLLDVLSGETVSIDGLEGPLTFTVTDDYMLANYEQHFFVIKDEQIVAEYGDLTAFDDLQVHSKLKGVDVHGVYYPQITYPDESVEKIINTSLNTLFDYNESINEDGVLERWFSATFTSSRVGDILQISRLYEYYGYGAAHGIYSEDSFNFDLTTGEIIDMKDIFKENVDYHLVLAKAMQSLSENKELYEDVSQMSDEALVAYFMRDVYSFSLQENSLRVNYNPYEIGPYTAGHVVYEIPYETIINEMDLDKPYLAFIK